ncbi:ABC transporter permease [Sedimentitalea sp. XS_ASV28]|uniref:ABC transporter permease n=1 Tax=Sedimentitalea sp. XS_ASV28 TaxID=3241296 RepID=UPI003518BD58
MAEIEFLVAGTIAASTVFLLAALGELVAEKSGMLNLGVEGMMALGAVVGFIVTKQTGDHFLAFLLAGVAGMAIALVFAVTAITFMASQVATGLAIGILGLGMAATIGNSYESQTVEPLGELDIPLLGDLPVVGAMFFQHDVMVYITLLLAGAIAVTMTRTRIGRIIRAVGENPHAAQALGCPVPTIRYLCVLFGGCLAGWAGCYAATVLTPLWGDGMIAGRGWIAIALVVFGTWRVGRLIVGAYLFGFVSLSELIAQSVGIAIPSQVLTAAPYALTIIVLAIISRHPERMRIHVPFSLGEVFARDRPDV